MSRWFLPESPDVIGLLREQSGITVEGIDAFSAWADGDAEAANRVRDAEHRADEQKRGLRRALRIAFTTPLDPEDLYTLSERLDTVLNSAKDTVREAEVMATPPDAAIAEMTQLIARGVHQLDEGFGLLMTQGDGAIDAADAAVKSGRTMEKVYRRAMSELLTVDDPREQMSRRELYRRCSRIADAIEGVADRIWYAEVKER